VKTELSEVESSDSALEGATVDEASNPPRRSKQSSDSHSTTSKKSSTLPHKHMDSNKTDVSYLPVAKN